MSAQTKGPGHAPVVRGRSWAQKHPKTFRLFLNRWPCFRGTGGKVTFIADDWSEMRVKLPLNRRTNNYVNTIFGGSIYASCDPHFMFMLMHRLGSDYVVWDKAATVRFRRPGRSTLTATFKMPDAEIEEVKRLLETNEKVDRTYSVDLVDAAGVPHATIEKVVNVRKARASTPPPT